MDQPGLSGGTESAAVRHGNHAALRHLLDRLLVYSLSAVAERIHYFRHHPGDDGDRVRNRADFHQGYARETVGLFRPQGKYSGHHLSPVHACLGRGGHGVLLSGTFTSGGTGGLDCGEPDLRVLFRHLLRHYDCRRVLFVQSGGKNPHVGEEQEHCGALRRTERNHKSARDGTETETFVSAAL